MNLRPAQLPEAETIPPREFSDYVRLATCCRVIDLIALRREMAAAGFDRKATDARD